MPNRLIREGLMESEQVLSIPVEARWLFVIVILSADDLGLFEAAEFALARRADVRREMASKLMQILADADLIRFYEVNGKRYGFIPKFRQRLQIKRSRYPLPPQALMADDSDAISKIKGLGSNPTDAQPLDSGCATVGQPSEPEPEPEAESKAKVVGGAPVESPASPTAPRKRSATSSRGSRLPESWALPKAWGEWALEQFPHWGSDVVRLEAEKFSNHYRAAPGKAGLKLDWRATWRNWCLSDIAQRAHPMGAAAIEQQASAKREWHDTPAGIKAKGAELGMPWSEDGWVNGEHMAFPTYSSRVKAKARATEGAAA